ncbi:ATP-binding protein [Streptomyces albireticuli]|uniref:ATP-binding protein n=1 Tax=Streptomyces albireticuli TaxID=1940 RepID=A0A2A2CZE2_9ACTN|nr:ATP-binding protein [Streptomyces albireticuli]MCD9145818.1 ATP-binding protein [Streptomyces albireticuli]MCD9165895.1 ATP-binding protein [Streptomyces albireticuli]MCD9194426.1 ATP-binding protein [Streptomyces albireticuli]PAU44529.1 ATP-binding protein [Streptomyces albireticuli]
METDGIFDPRDIGSNPPPRPAAPPKPSAPPLMSGRGEAFVDWLRTPRAVGVAPGTWKFAYRPKPPEEPDRIPGRQLVSGALISLVCGWLVWSLCWNGYLGSYWLWPLLLFTPDSWRKEGGSQELFVWSAYFYYALFALVLVVGFGRLGRWQEVGRRYVLAPSRRLMEQRAPAPKPEADPLEWPELRAAGGVASAAADRLAGEARAGLMSDVDHARIARAWESVRIHPTRFAAFIDAVQRLGAAACRHPSGGRDLPVRIARHDLLTRQVRIGAAVEDVRNPYQHRGVGVALDPDLLGTSLVAVGPAGSGKTAHLVRPVVESLCLQALAGQAAVIAVGSAGAVLAPDDAFDVIVRTGETGSRYGLDLYGGTTDPDAAAGMLAEGLVGDLTALEGGGSRRAAAVLAQLLGPYRAIHGRFPSVPELRELLDGSPAALGALRSALEKAGEDAQLRELDARERQSSRPGDVGALLADRIALLDRPAFTTLFDSTAGDRLFSLRALDHPLRVRIDLPARGHTETSRILTRLVLAQFTEHAVARRDRSVFAALVLDDASHTITAEALRGIQRLRSVGAGAVLTIRTLEEVPEPLRAPLLGSVGCRMAFAGVTTWEGARFAEVWGKEWVETRDVTNQQVIAHEPLTRASHVVRRIVTGRAVTAESVTVRKVERERWSASELAHSVPAGHAVISLTTVRGERVSPLLVDLRPGGGL